MGVPAQDICSDIRTLYDRPGNVYSNHFDTMTVYQCGFIASDVSSPDCSKDIASAEPVPVTGAELATVYQGGWGFGIASSSAGEVYAWGVNAATLLDKQGETRGPTRTGGGVPSKERRSGPRSLIRTQARRMMARILPSLTS